MTDKPLKDVKPERPVTPPTPSNGLTTPSPKRISEAVREANDPRRLVSDQKPENSLRLKYGS